MTRETEHIESLISSEYRQLNEELHDRESSYGTGAGHVASLCIRQCAALGLTKILDYGCGKGVLSKPLRDAGLEVVEYDPAIPGKDSLPEPQEFVACIDVLEHIEPDYLENVLAHIARLATNYMLYVIDNRPAKKVLSDGRNAHLIVQEPDWWVSKLKKHMIIDEARIVPQGQDQLFTLIFARPI